MDFAREGPERADWEWPRGELQRVGRMAEPPVPVLVGQAEKPGRRHRQ